MSEKQAKATRKSDKARIKELEAKLAKCRDELTPQVHEIHEHLQATGALSLSFDAPRNGITPMYTGQQIEEVRQEAIESMAEASTDIVINQFVPYMVAVTELEKLIVYIDSEGAYSAYPMSREIARHNLTEAEKKLDDAYLDMTQKARNLGIEPDFPNIAEAVYERTQGIQKFTAENDNSDDGEYLRNVIRRLGGRKHHEMLDWIDDIEIGGRKSGMTHWRECLGAIWLDKKNEGKTPHKIKQELLEQWGQKRAGQWEAKEGLIPWQYEAFDSVKNSKTDADNYADNLLRAYRKVTSHFKPLLND